MNISPFEVIHNLKIKYLAPESNNTFKKVDVNKLKLIHHNFSSLMYLFGVIDEHNLFWKYTCFDVDTKGQCHDEKDQDRDSIQNLGGSMTGGMLRKA